MKCYQGMTNFLADYEEVTLSHNVDGDENQLIMTRPGKHGLRDNMKEAVQAQRNPIVDMYHWAKGELYDLAAIKSVLSQREKIGQQVIALRKKKDQVTGDIQSISTGKKNMNTVFKDTTALDGMKKQEIEAKEEYQSAVKLFDLVSFYVSKKLIPRFKEEKLQLYGRILMQYHVVEINNSHAMANLWDQVLDNKGVKEAHFFK